MATVWRSGSNANAAPELMAVDDQPAGLSYHREHLIFENDIEWDILRLEFRDRDFGQIDVDLVTLPELVRRLNLFLIDENVAPFDQALQSRA